MGKRSDKRHPPPIYVEVGGTIIEAISATTDAFAKLVCKICLYFRIRLDLAIKRLRKDSKRRKEPNDPSDTAA